MSTNRDLSAEARSAKVDRLDDAIDQVAARMTRVDDDAELSTRIVAALPERSGWSLSWLVPRLAITAVLGLATATVLLRMFDDGSASVLGTFDGRSTNVPLAVAALEHRTYVEPASNVGRTIVEPLSNDRLNDPDHDRSLPALEASVLTFDSLAPVALSEDALLTVEPLEIADLPLTADSFPQR
jgi:hypothetical protein